MSRILLFELDGQRYALPAEDVVEVQLAVAEKGLPGAPEIVEGIVDVRGSVVAVIDVRRRLRLPPRPLSASDHLVVARARGPSRTRVVALRVDRAVDLATLPPGAVEEAPSVLPGVEHIAGVARVAGEIVLIHDLRTFLSLDEARTLDDAMAAGARA